LWMTAIIGPFLYNTLENSAHIFLWWCKTNLLARKVPGSSMRELVVFKEGVEKTHQMRLRVHKMYRWN